MFLTKNIVIIMNDKELLLQDICCRLPYEVKVNVNSEYLSEELIKSGYDKPLVVYGVTADGSISFTLDKFLMEYSMPILSIKPYLFPLSSMTEEQKKEEYEICKYYLNGYESKLIDFYHKNHLDYRGLISKELAIDATNLNIY